MARIPLPQPERMTRSQRAQYDRFPSNLTRALVLMDDQLAGQLPKVANALRASSLEPAWREGIILRVAASQHSAYERFQHLTQALQNGWSQRQIEAIESGDYSTGLAADFVKVLTFVDHVIAGPHVPDADFQAARSVLSDRDLATVVVPVGHYMSVARLLGILDVECDDTPDDWSHEH